MADQQEQKLLRDAYAYLDARHAALRFVAEAEEAEGLPLALHPPAVEEEEEEHFDVEVHAEDSEPARHSSAEDTALKLQAVWRGHSARLGPVAARRDVSRQIANEAARGSERLRERMTKRCRAWLKLSQRRDASTLVCSTNARCRDAQSARGTVRFAACAGH